MLESTKMPKTLDNAFASLGRHHQDRPHTTGNQNSHLEKSRGREAPWHSLLFQTCSYQLHTFLNMLKQRQDHRSGKLESREMKSLRRRFKVNFQECLGGERLLEFDKVNVYNRSFLFWCRGTVLNWMIRKWNCVNKYKVVMKRTVMPKTWDAELRKLTLYSSEKVTFACFGQCNIWKKKLQGWQELNSWI